MKKTFSINQLFKDSWVDYKKHWTLFILVGIIFLLVGFLGNLGVSVSPEGYVSQSPIVGILAWLLQIFITLGYIKFVLNVVDNKEAKIEQLFHGAHSWTHFLSFVVVSLLTSALIGLGTLLFIIPGIVLTIGLVFAQYIAAEEKAGIFESLKISWNATKGNAWKILWFMIVVAFFNLFGLLALVIGLVITIPMTAILYARLYRTLVDTEESDESDSEIEIEVEEVLEGDQSETEE
ncbi:MAG: hypothetical protein MRY57_01520 [Candidatus Pacebacteria bacterium]|nr:hypothetical protein [Candidatus Paceibacterota bacterium]